jgi:predicted  nucleic acid-binding Zn-ribbon protein
VKDMKILLLGMLSVGLVGTWVYHLYDKTQYSQKRNEVFVIDSTAVAQAIQDSLQRIYTYTIDTLGARLDSTKTKAERLKGNLGKKLNEINRLRSEIFSIIKKNGVNKSDLSLARSKSVELQQLVGELQNRNNSVEEEKKQLSAVLDKVSNQVKYLETNMEHLSQENKALSEKVKLAATFVASEIKLTPVTVKNGREIETSLTRKASKIVVSFNVQNHSTDYENAELYIVLMQPDTRLFKNEDVWDASTTRLTNGKEITYTRKLKLEYLKAEVKPVLFSLTAPQYLKGTYTLQIYHNGQLIGQATKSLN